MGTETTNGKPVSTHEETLFNVLLNKTANVRSLQKEYYKTRNIGVLKECKEAERDLDEVIERIRKPKLFDNG
jgi:hypothetical protein